MHKLLNSQTLIYYTLAPSLIQKSILNYLVGGSGGFNAYTRSKYLQKCFSLMNNFLYKLLLSLFPVPFSSLLLQNKCSTNS